ncbi:unannotated protein [freshwater metagenome]|uniref:Unannotated protein n=1 Tax=freshwater metagenome TaxID=449393 RepID=A0A6J6JPI4_9ZZZZ
MFSRISVPSARSAAIIRSLSLDFKTPCRVVGPLAKADKTSSRLFNDFEPGREISARNSLVATGASQAGE